MWRQQLKEHSLDLEQLKENVVMATTSEQRYLSHSVRDDLHAVYQ